MYLRASTNLIIYNADVELFAAYDGALRLGRIVTSGELLNDILQPAHVFRQKCTYGSKVL